MANKRSSSLFSLWFTMFSLDVCAVLRKECMISIDSYRLVSSFWNLIHNDGSD